MKDASSYSCAQSTVEAVKLIFSSAKAELVFENKLRLPEFSAYIKPIREYALHVRGECIRDIVLHKILYDQIYFVRQNVSDQEEHPHVERNVHNDLDPGRKMRTDRFRGVENGRTAILL